MRKARDCIICGTDISYRYHNCKYCESCARAMKRKHNRENARKYYRQYIKDGRIYKYRQDMRKRQRKKYREDIQYRLYRRAKSSAAQRNILCTITKADIQVPEKCPVFGTLFSENHDTMYRATLDRIDSSKGYEPGNIQVISWLANTMKNNATPEELVLFARWILRTVHLVHVEREPNVPEVMSVEDN